MKNIMGFVLALLLILLALDTANEWRKPFPRRGSVAYLVRNWLYEIGPRPEFDPDARMEADEM